MGQYTLQFVDSIGASPTVRLDLNSWPLMFDENGLNFDPAPVKRIVASSALTDGDRITGLSWGNRTLVIPVQLVAPSVDAAADRIQALARELVRAENFVKVQFGGSQPYFFHTYAAPDFVPQLKRLYIDTARLELKLPADPFGLGPMETLPAVTVFNDPAEGVTLNSNPFFETNVANWTNAQGLTSIVRTTSDFHQGIAAMAVTPDGTTANPRVQSETVPVTVGTTYSISGWLRSNSGTPTVNLQVQWLDAGLASLGFAGTTIALNPSNTWIFAGARVTAPANAAFARLTMFYAGTPAAINIVQLDEMRIRQAGGAGATYFDLTGIKGDVETPLNLSINSAVLNQTVDRRMVVSVRRRGTPSAAPMVLHAEDMTLGTDASLVTNDSTASGASFVRISGWTNALLAPRLTVDPFPAAAGQDVRGSYRVFARIKGSPAGAGGATVQLRWGVFAQTISNDEIPLPNVTPTVWGWFDLGLVQYPRGVDPVTDGMTGLPLSVRGQRIEVAVAKGATTTNVDIDCLRFMPATPGDDLLGYITAPPRPNASATALIVDSARRLGYFVGAGGEVWSSAKAPQPVAGMPAVVPGQANRIGFLLDTNIQTGGDQIGDVTVITPSYQPRYTWIRTATT